MVAVAGGRSSETYPSPPSLKDFIRSPQIRLDLEKAADYYEEESATLSLRFLAAFGKAVRLARTHSSIGSRRHEISAHQMGLRYVITEGFPYLLFYKEGVERIVLLRLLHMSRNIAPAFRHR